MNKNSATTSSATQKIENVVSTQGTAISFVPISKNEEQNDYKKYKVITEEDKKLYKVKTMTVEKIILK